MSSALRPSFANSRLSFKPPCVESFNSSDDLNDDFLCYLLSLSLPSPAPRAAFEELKEAWETAEAAEDRAASAEVDNQSLREQLAHVRVRDMAGWSHCHCRYATIVQ